MLDANGFQSVGAARFFINGLDTTTQGIDAVGSYRWRPTSFGNWTLTAAYNYNKTKIDRRINELGPLATIPGIVLFGRGRGHPLHRRPAARQDRAQRRRRDRRFRR